MADLSVRVLNDDEEPLKGIPVRIEFTSQCRGMTGTEYTDSDGYAYFSNFEEGDINLYIDHKNYGGYRYSDGESINVTK